MNISGVVGQVFLPGWVDLLQPFVEFLFLHQAERTLLGSRDQRAIPEGLDRWHLQVHSRHQALLRVPVLDDDDDGDLRVLLV